MTRGAIKLRMKKHSKQLIVVLGMHRSGTSVVTRGLQVMGVDLGNKLMPPVKGNNEKGFWEDLDINSLNIEMLNSLSIDWHFLTPIQSSDVSALRRNGYVQKAVELLREKASGPQVFGFKDPRVTKLLPFWKEVVAQSQLKANYILTIRHPLSVCHSLAKRDGFEIEKGALLWLDHMISSLVGTAGENCIVVDYDNLIQSPADELKRIAKGIQLQIDLLELKRFETEFLDKKLRHTFYQPNELVFDEAVPLLAREVYIEVLKVAMDDRQLDAASLQNKIARWNNEFSRQRSALRLADKLTSSLTEKEQTVQGVTSQLVERDVQLQELAAQIQALTNQLAERDVQIQALTKQIQGLTTQLHEITISKAWKVVMMLRRIRVFLFPPGSWQEQMVSLLLRGVRGLRVGGAGAVLAQGMRKIKQLLTRGKKVAVALSRSETDTKSGKETYVPLNQENVDPKNILAKVIAFYLPQFHPIPENDDWWGKGFTEWTNVAKAAPNFAGHYQPHQPDELGFYDLRILEVQERQVELAKKYGIHGFCFYYYWFAGKRLLERPLDQYLSHPHLDLPFCLCWANENWTRRWDGAEHDVLIAQEYTEEQYLHFIRDISLNFSDPRYIYVDGKPILLVYRINLLPNPQKAAEVWRSECRKMGIGEIYLVAVQSFGITDPRPYGFDAAVEFPPSYLSQAEVSLKSVKITNPRFAGKIFDYNTAAHLMLEKKHGDYTLFKTVMPSWDNTARRQNESHIFINATPSAYQSWLENVVSYTRKNLPEGKRFVFVNAWNEWAEGTHLEPDRRYGYAYLQATADAIQGIANKKFPFPPGWKLLFISHDAHKGGAQAALLSTLEWFKEHTSLSIKILCLEGGALLSRFEALADTIVLNELGGSLEGNKDELTERLLDFCGWEPDLIYGNTVVAGKAYQWLHTLGVPILTHVYELEMSIQRYAAEWMGDVLKYSTQYITPSQAVKDNLVKNHAVDSSKITVVYGAVSNEPLHQYESDKEKIRERKKLGLDARKILVVGCGLGMPFRKGADLFIKLGDILLHSGRTDFHFYWVGGFEDSESDLLNGIWADHRAKLAKNNLGDFVTFLGYKENFKDYFQAADIFVLPSREDPLPLVAIEAAKCGLPLVCFAGAGGTPDLVGDDAGFVVPFEDTEAMAEKILKLMDDLGLRTAMGKRAREKFLSQFTVERTTPNILSTCRKVAGQKPAVSIIVPNYNHAKYLPERLESIFNQTFQDFEVLLLDDASTDDSMEVLRQYVGYGDVRVYKSDQNSGSPFRQWLVGLDMARADILWIAESDDVCKPEFLENLLPAFRDPAVKLAYANSEVIDENGHVVGDYSSDTAEYLTSLSLTKWKSSYITNANREINDALGIKNTILNVSAVLLRIRQFDLSLDFRETLGKMRIAGDWYFYVRAIKDGKVYYDFRKWNSHRRHSNSVIAQTVSDNKIGDFFREFSIVQKYIFSSYQLDTGFRGKWEQYLLQQLREFSPGSSYDVLKQYYPLDEMRALISNVQSSHSS